MKNHNLKHALKIGQVKIEKSNSGNIKIKKEKLNLGRQLVATINSKKFMPLTC